MALSSEDRLTRLMIKDLAKSGIPEEYIVPLGLRTLSRQETADYMRPSSILLPTYEIPYFSKDGKPIGYGRLKNLGPMLSSVDDAPKQRAFGGKQPAKRKPPPKYLQKANSAPHLYIPPVLEWPTGDDGRIIVQRLVITEGEKKAIKACITGIPCVALGGVDSFKSGKRGIFLLEEFEAFDFESTEIEICYDSDFNTNENVRKAMRQLASELITLNPMSISYVMLDAESTGNGKLGLDDFLHRFKEDEKAARKAFAKLPRKLDSQQDVMLKLNNELCYLRSAGSLYNVQEDRYYPSEHALITDYGPRFKVPDPDDPRKKVPAVKLWLDSRNSETWCDALVYEPGKERRYRPKGAKGDHINLWRKSEVRPMAGDATPWLDLVKFLTGTDQMYTWLLQWLAYPLQHPGTKLLQGVFVWSYAQGIGKNFIIEPLIRKIYGPAYQVIKASELESDFNAWAKCKQFIFGEEIYMSDRRDRETTMGHLKSLVTNEYVDINAKYRQPERFKNYAQLYLTANQPNALALDPTDRRIAVIHAPEQPLSEEYYKNLHSWSQQRESAGIVLNHLLNEVDCSMFNPRANAPFNDDKEELVEQGRDMVQRYSDMLRDSPNIVFDNNGKLPDQQIFTSSELFAAINIYAKLNNLPEIKISVDSLGRYLAKSNIPHRRLSMPNMHKTTFYAVFKAVAWRKRTDDLWRTHIGLNNMDYKSRKKDKYEGGVKDDGIRKDLPEGYGSRAKVTDITPKK